MYKFDDGFMSCLKADIATQSIPFLAGEPGIGKTAFINKLAKRNHTKCFTLACNELAMKEDLTGCRTVPHTKADGTVEYVQEFFPHVIVNKAINYALEHKREKPILFLDELNRTDESVTSALLSIATTRMIGTKDLPHNLIVICAGNVKGNITALDTASISRFVKYEVEPDAMTYLNVEKDVHPIIEKVLKDHPDLIFCKEIKAEGTAGTDEDSDDDFLLTEGNGMNLFTTPRTISSLSRWLNALANDELQMMENSYVQKDGVTLTLLEAAVQSHTGKTLFSAEVYNELVQMMNASAMTAATKVKVPEKPDCFDALKNSTSIAQLDNEISQLNPSEKSACLLYGMYVKEDTGQILKHLLLQTETLSQEDWPMFFDLLNADELDEQNLEEVVNSNTKLGDMIKGCSGL